MTSWPASLMGLFVVLEWGRVTGGLPGRALWGPGHLRGGEGGP